MSASLCDSASLHGTTIASFNVKITCTSSDHVFLWQFTLGNQHLGKLDLQEHAAREGCNTYKYLTWNISTKRCHIQVDGS